MRQYYDAMKARSVHTIIHIGAGKGTELAAYLTASPALIVLVEPNPDAVKVLRHKAEARPEVEVVAAAVAAERGESDLAVLNLPEMSSLREPTGLYELYPGLKVLQHRRVETVPLTDLLAHAPAENDGENWLIVDAPGEEYALIDALIENAALRRFQQVVLHCGRAPLYEGAAAGEEVVALLEEHGFTLDGSPDEQDPDRPIWQLRLDQNRIESERLGAELSSLQQRLEASEGENATLKEQNAALTAERDQLARDVAASEQLAQERERLHEALNQKQQELERLQSDLSVALRMQSVRESDLRDLQERYGELLETKKQQDELLAKLTNRLGAAAEHLKLMEAKSDGGDAPDAAVGELVRALSGSAEK